MLRCPYCGELVTGEREYCIGCGRAVPDPARPVDHRLRAWLIGAFVFGALVLVAGMVRDALRG